ncbi:hypothetical protein B0I35DRAFT_444336 [Stachybotrys elegans]|uniref:Rhodopsin domain-containing protein n=1 Tax=Stachybotrys elegans TaxID=80388 RepID=A0A8K0WK67_9HYPO|nr:hypothetical protein B0I35DRAFT_444336 [Stachybotrys elegans]
MSEASPQFSGPPSDDRGPGFRTYIVLLTVVAVAVTCLRFWSRLLTQQQTRIQHRLWWDDWAAMAATLSLICQMGLTITLVDSGLGRHAWEMSLNQISRVLMLLYAEYFIFDVTLVFAKASALFFLVRIFPHTDRNWTWFTIGIWVTHGMNMAWLVGKVFGLLFVCDPISKNWMPWVPGTCGPTNSLYIGSAVPSVAIDLIIMLLPLPKIWRLHMSRARKCGVMITFILGYCAIIVSFGRLITVLLNTEALNNDITFEAVGVFYWAWAEPPVTILCICLPAMLRLTYHLKSTYLQPITIKTASFFSRATSVRHSELSSYQNDRGYKDLSGKYGLGSRNGSETGIVHSFSAERHPSTDIPSLPPRPLRPV